MMKPKVYLVGGPDVEARIELMQALTEQYEMHALGSEKRLAAEFERAGLSYTAYPLARTVNPLADLRTMLALTRFFRNTRPDVVHTFDTKPSILGRAAAQLAGTPVVIGTITGLGSLYMVEQSLVTRAVRRIYETLQRLASHLADLTIFYNAEDVRYFVEHKLVQPGKATVLPGSGVPTRRFRKERFSEMEKARLCKDLGIQAEQKVVTMVARLVRSKGILLYAEAARQVQALLPQTIFILIGPRDEQSMDGLTEEEIAGLFPTVHWIGPRSDVEKYLAISDLFVLPAQREGLPRALLEAAAMSLPLIATDLPGCREVITEGVNGLLVPPEDPEALAQAMCTILEQRELRLSFGLASRHMAVERYDLGMIARQLSEIYARLLEQETVEACKKSLSAF